MAEYEFHCQDCDHRFTLVQSMHKPRPKACPACRKRKNFGAVIAAPIGVRGEPTTVGSMAERNTKRLSKEEYERALTPTGSDISREEKRYLDSIGVKVVNPNKKKPEKIPWFRDGSVPGTKRLEKPLDVTKISNMQRYIETGK